MGSNPIRGTKKQKPLYGVLFFAHEGFEGYIQKANSFAFLITPALEEKFFCVAKNFGGRGIPYAVQTIKSSPLGEFLIFITLLDEKFMPRRGKSHTRYKRIKPLLGGFIFCFFNNSFNSFDKFLIINAFLNIIFY